MYNTFLETDILILKKEENYQYDSAGNSNFNFFREDSFSRLNLLHSVLQRRKS